MIKQTNALLVPTMIAIGFFLGVESGGFQLALARVAEEFALNNTFMGALVSAQFAAMMITPFVFGAIADRIGKKKVLLLAVAFFICGSAVIIWVPKTIAFVIGIFLVGAGFSIGEATSCAALADAHPEEAGRYVNIAQCFFSMGAVVSPLATHYAIHDMGLNWRVVFMVCGGAFAVILVLLIMTRFRQFDHSTRESARIKRGMRDFVKGIAVLWILITLYVCIENGLGYFLDSLFTFALGAPDMSAKAISGFWLLMMISRAICSLVKINGRVIRWGFLLSTAVIVALAAAQTWWVAFACCVLLGFIFGPIWPMLMGTASSRYIRYSGTITGIMMTGSALGGAMSPPLMGGVADILGMRAAFVLLAAIALAAYVISRQDSLE